MALSPRERLILPLDVPTLKEATYWIDLLAESVGVFKVGSELFTAAGPDAVRAVHDAGAVCFLDLKVNDIPTTMGRTVAAASQLGVRYLTVHAASGTRALRESAKAATGTDTRLLAVTVLTSLDDSELDAIGVAGTVEDAVRRRAAIARKAGIDGLVCSAQECAALRQHLGTDPLLVVPGIRPAGGEAADQARTATPREAITDGADLLVVGRPIRHASDPVAAAQRITDEIAQSIS